MNFNINYQLVFIIIIAIMLFIKLSNIIVERIYAEKEMIDLGKKINKLLESNISLSENFPIIASKYIDNVEYINIDDNEYINLLANEFDKLEALSMKKNEKLLAHDAKMLLSLELNLILTMHLKLNHFLFYINYKRELKNLDLIPREELLYENY